MRVLALNAGSSSLKATVRDEPGREPVVRVEVERVQDDWSGALGSLGATLAPYRPVDVVVHRIVHGGPHHDRPVVLDDRLVEDLRASTSLAPLHLPAALRTIRWARRRWPEAQQVACFDTAFHAALPDRARTLPVSRLLREEGFRRYGFHGLSLESVVVQCPDLGDAVVAHLGSGCSVTAVDGTGRSRWTTMSYSPGSGMVSATRAGDLDPEIVLQLWERGDLSVPQAREELNRHSGLTGVAGRGDLRDLVTAEDPHSRLAVEMFVQSAAMSIAAAATTLERWRSLVFTGGVGEHNPEVRDAICARLRLDGVKTQVVPADEELVMDAAARGIAGRGDR